MKGFIVSIKYIKCNIHGPEEEVFHLNVGPRYRLEGSAWLDYMSKHALKNGDRVRLMKQMGLIIHTAPNRKPLEFLGCIRSEPVIRVTEEFEEEDAPVGIDHETVHQFRNSQPSDRQEEIVVRRGFMNRLVVSLTQSLVGHITDESRFCVELNGIPHALMIDHVTEFSYIVKIEPVSMLLLEPPSLSYQLFGEWNDFAGIAGLKIGSTVGFQPKFGEIMKDYWAYHEGEPGNFFPRIMTFNRVITVCRLS